MRFAIAARPGPAVASLDEQRHPVRLREDRARQDALGRPGRDDPPGREHEGVVEAGRDLLEVVRDEHDRRPVAGRRRARSGPRGASRGPRGRGWRPARRAAAGPGRASAPGRSRRAVARLPTGSRTAGRRRRSSRRVPARPGRGLGPSSEYSCHHGSVAAWRAVMTRSTGRRSSRRTASTALPAEADTPPELARHRPSRSASRGPRPCPRSATASGRRPRAASSCPSHWDRARPSVRPPGPASRAVRGSSGRPVARPGRGRRRSRPRSDRTPGRSR